MSKRRGYDDQEIDLLQQRIYLHRLSLRLRVEDLKDAIRERVRRPSTLISAAGVGFVLERLVRRPRHKAPTEDRPGRKFLALFPEAMYIVLKFAGSGPGLWLASRLAARATQSESQPTVEAPSQLPSQPV